MDSSCVGNDIGIGNWSMSTYRRSMYTSANSCVDRLNTEGGRDSASRLMCGDPHLPAFMPQVRTTLLSVPGVWSQNYWRRIGKYQPLGVPLLNGIAHCLVPPRDKLSSAIVKVSIKLLQTVEWQTCLATSYGLWAVIWYFTGKVLATKQFNAAYLHPPHNVLHSPSEYLLL